jgi:hypothetical protein
LELTTPPELALVDVMLVAVVVVTVGALEPLGALHVTTTDEVGVALASLEYWLSDVA